MQAFILSAGKGTRLYPYTKVLPKPLFPILGKPIIQIILDQLKNAGFKLIGINVFHLKNKLLEFLKKYQQNNPQIELKIFEEKELLGTGGGIINAKEFFKTSTLIINADILTNFNFKNFFYLCSKTSDPINIVLYRGSNNNVIINPGSNLVISFRKKDKNSLTFAGIQIIKPEIIKSFPYKKDLIEIYEELINKGIKITAYIEKNSYFKDIGTIENYLKAHENILLKKIQIKEIPFFEKPFIIKSKKIGNNVVFKNWVYIEEDTVIEKDTQLSKVITWKGAYIKSGNYENCLLI